MPCRPPDCERPAVVIRGGGHGLATAYRLAKKHGTRRVALLELGHIGQGNSGRDTQVTRSNCFNPASSNFFDHSLRLYEGLGRELNLHPHVNRTGQAGMSARLVSLTTAIWPNWPWYGINQ
jgi:glycine/D-amino acid oxidase-like deaminating enzyme